MKDNARKIQANIEKLYLCSLQNEDGQSIPIYQLWEKAPAVFIFLRHFGCELCKSHAIQVWSKRSEYEDRGAKLYFIGNGPHSLIKDFKDRYHMHEARIFTDPSLKSFYASGFKRGFWIDPGEHYTRLEFYQGAIKRMMKGSPEGDTWQLGGILVVNPNGKVKYQFISQALGHYPPSSDIAIIKRP